MYERWYGSRYGDADNVRDVARIVRGELRHLVGAVDYSHHRGHPLGGIDRVSVRYRSASMMEAVDVRLFYRDHAVHRLDSDVAWQISVGRDVQPAQVVCTECGSDRWIVSRGRIEAHSAAISSQVEAAFAVVGAMVSAFNHDGSDVLTDYFDVRFYGDIGAVNPGREYGDASTIPSVWRRHIETLIGRADSSNVAEAEAAALLLAHPVLAPLVERVPS